MSRWAFIELLEYAGRFTLLVTVIVWLLGVEERTRQADDQRKAKHFQAWQVINSASGKSGDGGRNLALQELANNRVPMSGINLDNAVLDRLILTNRTRPPILNGASMRNGQFLRSSIANANMQGADLFGLGVFRSEITNSIVMNANLTNAAFMLSDFLRTDFSGAKLVNVELDTCNLARGSLAEADITKAQLHSVNLAYVYLMNLRGWQSNVNFHGCNVYGVMYAPTGFVDWVMKHGGVQTNITDFVSWTNYLWGKMKPAKGTYNSQGYIRPTIPDVE